MADEQGLTHPGEIAERAMLRLGEQAHRIAAYYRALQAYFQEHSAEGGDFVALNNYSDGRPALRAAGETVQGKAVRASPNYIKPIVKDIVSIKGAWPTVMVPPASGQQPDKDKAVKIARALRQQHEHSAMPRQQQRAGFFLSCLGDACYTIDPRTPSMNTEDPDPFMPIGIYFNVANPCQAFPKFRGSGAGEDLQDLFLISSMNPKDAREEYPHVNISRDRDEPVDVIHYYSRTERQTVVGGARAFGIVHNLGFCPAVWVRNEESDGRLAQSDISGCIELHSELADLWKVYVDSIWGSVYPIYVIKDPEQTSGVLEYGPGAQFSTHGTGDVKVLAPQADAQSAQLIFNAALDNLMKQAGISPIRLEGQIDRSNVSAKSVDRQQAPQEQRLKLSLALLGEGLQRLNAKGLLMLSNVKEFKDEPMELYGQDQDGTYNETFTGADIGGWTRNTVKWDAMTGQTQQESTIQALQLYKEGQGMFPFEEVLVAARYDDPTEIMERGKSEMQEKMAMQQAMQPQQPGGEAPPGAGGGGGAPGGSPGAAPPVQPPPVPGGGGGAPGGGLPNFKPVAQSPTNRKGSPAPVPDIQSEVETAVKAVAMRGTYQVLVKHQGFVVDVTDHRDVPAVKAAIKSIEQALAIRIAVVVVNPVKAA